MGSFTSRPQNDSSESTETRVRVYIDDEIKKLADEFVTLRGLQASNVNEAEQLRRENEKLSANHRELLAKHEELCRERETLISKHVELLQKGVQVKQVSSKISDQAIDDYVKEILSDPTVSHGRLSVITDAVEGAVYRKALKAVLHAVALAADSSHIQFIGHRVVFAIEPVEDECSIPQEEASVVGQQLTNL